MAGSASRTTALAGVVTGMALAVVGCGPSENQPIIGTPATASLPVSSTATSQALGAFEQQLVDQLNQADQTQSISDSTQITAEVNALANNHTLIIAEQIDALQQIGAAAVAKREATLGALSSEVRAAHLSSGQMSAILAVVDGIQAQLQALGAKIAGDGLADVLRSDVLSVDTSTRVYGLIDPMVHIAIGADRVSAEAASLANRTSSLGGRLSGRSLNYARETWLLSEVERQVSQVSSVSDSVVSQVLQLSPGGYPANTGTIQTLKNQLVGAESGPAAAAGEELAQVNSCLADDAASPATAC